MKYILGALWLFLTGLYYYAWNTARHTCCNSTVIVAPPKAHGPLEFNWGKAAAVTNSLFPAYRDSILHNLGPEDKLEITGLYDRDEPNTSSFENMGLARANEVKQLFLEHLSEDRIVLKSKLREDQVNKDEMFASATFRPLKHSKSLVEVDDKTIIYFPLNSNNKLNDAEVEAYLDKVAARVKVSGETVKLTGHTCDRGDASYNMRLGQRRADIVADYLKSKGVPADQIITESKGETEPMVSNTSDENRAKNRRTVLRILKNKTKTR